MVYALAIDHLACKKHRTVRHMTGYSQMLLARLCINLEPAANNSLVPETSYNLAPFSTKADGLPHVPLISELISLFLVPLSNHGTEPTARLCCILNVGNIIMVLKVIHRSVPKLVHLLGNHPLESDHRGARSMNGGREC